MTDKCESILHAFEEGTLFQYKNNKNKISLHILSLLCIPSIFLFIDTASVNQFAPDSVRGNKEQLTACFRP